MQHLRSVGSGGETYMVEAPSQSKQKGKAVEGGKRGDGFQLNEAAARRAAAFEMPEDALPSHPLDEVSYTAATTSLVPEGGLRPDLDPSIRQVLEALDDEAYAADDGNGTDDEDAFWDGVLAGGEVHDAEEQELWSDEEDEGVSSAARKVGKMQLGGAEDEDEEAEGGWGAVNRFKKHGAVAGSDDDDDEEDYASEGGDTIADLKAASARRPQRRGAPSAGGSAFSMSSSAMFRNDQLRHLDDRFDQVRFLLLCFLSPCPFPY